MGDRDGKAQSRKRKINIQLLNLWRLSQTMAKLVLWLLSTQNFDKDVLVGGADLLLYLLNKALMYPSPLKGLGASLLCIFYAIQCVQHLAGQIPTALQRLQHLWLPELWRLALVRMPANTHQVFSNAWNTSLCLCQESSNVATSIFRPGL